MVEPLFMILGQSGATAAVQALEKCIDLHVLDYQNLRGQLIRDGQKLDVDREKYPPLPPDEEIPEKRKRYPSEPVIEDGCMVTLQK